MELCSKVILEIRSLQALALSHIQMATRIKVNGKSRHHKETARCFTKTVEYIQAFGSKESGMAKGK